eukprot:Skav205090  [mRNA]  locus=scaffold2214:75105:77068:+ [translate_table: standard]
MSADRGQCSRMAAWATLPAAPAVRAHVLVRSYWAHCWARPAGASERQGFAVDELVESPRRAALLSAALQSTAVTAQPALAQEGPEQREALYRGKVVGLRESAEWYRFFVGDIVKRP